MPDGLIAKARDWAGRHLWVALLILAAGFVLARLFTGGSETAERRVWFAALVIRGGVLDIVDRSVGGLHAGDVLGEVTVKMSRAEPAGGIPGLWPLVRDQAEYTVGLESDPAKTQSLKNALQSVHTRDADQYIRGLLADVLERQFPAMAAGGLIRENRPERVRVAGSGLLSAGLLVLATLALFSAAAVWTWTWLLPRLRAKRRVAAIERGDCPGCVLPLANLRDRRCPKCGFELTAEEFNRMRAVWRGKGIG